MMAGIMAYNELLLCPGKSRVEMFGFTCPIHFHEYIDSGCPLWQPIPFSFVSIVICHTALFVPHVIHFEIFLLNRLCSKSWHNKQL